MFVYVSGRRCLDFVGDHEAPTQLTRGAVDRAETAVGLGSSGRVVGRCRRRQRRRLGGSDGVAGSHLPDRGRPTRGPSAPARRRRPAERARLRTSAHATTAANRRYAPRGHDVATAGELGCGSARSLGRNRYRKRQTLCGSRVHPALPGCVASEEPTVVWNGHLRKPRESPSFSGSSARLIGLSTLSGTTPFKG